MQKVKIPVTLDPVRSAQKRSSYDGIVPLKNLARLSEQLLDTSGEVTVRIDCEIDEQKLVVLQGDAACEVQVRCERCQQPMTVQLSCQFAFTPVRSDTKALDHIPERYDVVVTDEHGEVNLQQLVEDELILTLPMYPMHDERFCAATDQPQSFGQVQDEPEKPNPFAVLQELKKK
ncbi:23S rRNA accumulation protein YceD [Alkalimonas delamerensis]|uniref:Large ribosomal RNA subunit accumulation protein YceD n=1 Tax=Alkalimonas delamerensis TaxID=265981 RepID=A0ABT9GS01_9GAMM|nr:23S rRNA accumulation protein YceD [Alkalimonas delamerensis]MDP4529436.1 23S rRNA accumulation protein YceD [Alkalimonas delamerensis]